MAHLTSINLEHVRLVENPLGLWDLIKLEKI